MTQSGGGCSLFSSAVNLPRGDVGTATRHGLEVSWSGGRVLANGAANDFVVYESGSSTAPEGFMVRAGLGGNFTGWHYFANSGFQQYVGSTDGAFATAFDLSAMGLAFGATIDRIQIANLVAADRLGASGLVNFSGVGSTHGFGSSSLDPDPLYVGALSRVSTVPEPATLVLLTTSLGAAAVIRRRRR